MRRSAEKSRRREVGGIIEKKERIWKRERIGRGKVEELEIMGEIGFGGED